MRNSGSNVANVGNANPDNGLNVNDWNRDNGNHNIGAVRLVVSSKGLILLRQVLLGGTNPATKHLAYFLQ